MYIFGNGIAGCLASLMNNNAPILICQETKPHKALMRFRSNQIGEAVGIPFKKVKVHKGIWHNDQPVPLSPRYISLYSRKVADNISYRSICNLDPVDRWIAPDNFHEMLMDMTKSEIYKCDDIAHMLRESEMSPKISTLPMPVLAKYYLHDLEFERSSSKIYVARIKVLDCDAHMTYYYTDPTIHMYRASITGDVLIIESRWPIENRDISMAIRSFGLKGVTEEKYEEFEQPLGKIIPICERKRKDFILKMTLNENIFSLGRFATWRNIVMDDVYHDINVIKGLIYRHKYDWNKEMT